MPPGSAFNLGSPKQIGEILFDELGCRCCARRPPAQPSTAEEVLEELADDYALPRLILEYRGLAKLKSTYTDKLPEQIDPGTGRVHTSYHQAVAATGRLSSIRSQPAEHPDPHRGGPAHPPGLHRAARPCAAGRGLLADRAAHHGAPVRRRASAARLRRGPGHPPRHRRRGIRRDRSSRSTAEQRRSAKAINFGLIYGMSAFGLARAARHRAAARRRSTSTCISQRYPGVKAFMDRTREQAARAGLCGDPVRPPPVSARHPRPQPASAPVRRAHRHQRAHAGHGGRHHQAGHDARATADARRATLPARMIMQVHDELVFEVGRRAVEEITAMLRTEMNGGGDACSAAEGGYRHRRQLGRGPLKMSRHARRAPLATLLLATLLLSTQAHAQAPVLTPAQQAARELQNQVTARDHQQMLDQLGITKLRPGPSGDPKSPDSANYDEARANPYPDWPDPLRLNNGKRVTSAKIWRQQRRPEIIEDFEREVLGRVPKNLPAVSWSISPMIESTVGGLRVLITTHTAHVDNSAAPDIDVTFPVTLIKPQKQQRLMPTLIMFNFRPPTFPADGPQAASLHTLIAAGWAVALVNPTTIQADNGAGTDPRHHWLGQQRDSPRKPDDWGALRAWGWGASARGWTIWKPTRQSMRNGSASKVSRATAKQHWSPWLSIRDSRWSWWARRAKGVPNSTAATSAKRSKTSPAPASTTGWPAIFSSTARPNATFGSPERRRLAGGFTPTDRPVCSATDIHQLWHSRKRRCASGWTSKEATWRQSPRAKCFACWARGTWGSATTTATR